MPDDLTSAERQSSSGVRTVFLHNSPPRLGKLTGNVRIIDSAEQTRHA
jgi:hypothetical protein